MVLLVILLAFPITIIIHYLKSKHIKARKGVHPPGPKGLPFIGNLLQFDAQSPHTYLWRLSRKYGPVMSLKLGFKQVVVISSANVVKQVIKSHDLTFSGRPSFRGGEKLSYGFQDMALSTYDDTWREMRKICTVHLFSSKHVQSFRPVREEEVSRMIKRIEMDSSLSKISNLSEMVISLASNIICRVAFGKSYGDENYEKSRFSTLAHQASAVLGGFFFADYFPYLRWLDNVTGMEAKLEKSFRDLDLFYQELIDEHLDYDNRPNSMNGDILDLLLELRRKRLTSVDLTLDRIKALILDILLGGIDTTSSFLIWGMTFLMMNQPAMSKVQAELRQYAGNKSFLNEDDIDNLPYFRAVVKETFRIYAPVPLLIPRETLQECNLNGYEIESGTMVYINAWAIARDPDIWKNPNEFVPERLFDIDIEMKGKDPELIPFGIGRRGCPGYSTGLPTVGLALANLLYKFNWEFPDDMKKDDVDFDTLPGITVSKKTALCLVAKPFHI